MPRGDGTGPMGMGPMTGRGAGFCAGYPAAGFMNPIPGRGFWGRGLGFGRGRGQGGRRWAFRGPGPFYGPYGAPAVPYAPPTPKEESQFLRDQADALEDQLEQVRKRLDELEKEPAETA